LNQKEGMAMKYVIEEVIRDPKTGRLRKVKKKT